MKRMTTREKHAIDEALNMREGYVLDFTNATIEEFFEEEFGLDFYRGREFSGDGNSKAKRLRAFIEKGDAGLVARVLRSLWDYRDAIGYHRGTEAEEGRVRDRFLAFIVKLEGDSPAIDTAAFERFEPSETLEQLIAAIKRDLDADRPEAALDRLHTYCMKRFAGLIKARGGTECPETEALHARVGRYVKIIKAERNLTEMAERIVKSSISVFESFNHIRNSQSLAHDNERLVDADEARFIFESVAAILRFVKRIDAPAFEQAA